VIVYCRWRKVWPSGTLLDVLVPRPPWARRSAAGQFSSIPEAFGPGPNLPGTLDSGHQSAGARSSHEAILPPQPSSYDRSETWGVLALLLILSRLGERGIDLAAEWCPRAAYPDSLASGASGSRDYALSALLVLDSTFCEGGLRMAQLIELGVIVGSVPFASGGFMACQRALQIRARDPLRSGS